MLQRNQMWQSVSYAAEYLIGKYMAEHIEKSILTLKDNYVLVEINFHAEPLDLYDVIFKLKTNGFKPILAPERYLYYLNDFNKFYKLKNLVVYFTKFSFYYRFWKKVLELSNKLLAKN